MSNSFHFLTNLAINPKQQEAFIKDPDAVMKRVGLSESEQIMFRNGNNTEIVASFAGKLFQAASFTADPNPDPLPDPDPPAIKTDMNFTNRHQ